MKTVQDGLIKHIEYADLGFERVKAYAGEVQEAIKNPAILTGLLPLALVVYLDGDRRLQHGTYHLDVLVWHRTDALQMQAESQDALALSEALVRHLEAKFSFTHNGRIYTIDHSKGIASNTLLVGNAYTIINVSVEVKEI